MQVGQLWEPDYRKGVGRTIKATRDIKIGEIVLEDSALLAVPDGFPVCLGCLDRVDGSSLCPGCGCPLCGDQCDEISAHEAECELLAKNKVIPAGIDCSAPHGLYAVLAVVRALLLKHDDPKEYEAVEELMDHWEERREEKGVVEMVRFMGAFCRTKLGMDWVTDEDVQHAFGVLKTNGVGHGSKKCYLYPNLSLISHSCAANLDMVDRPARSIQLVAKRMIKRGEELTWSYTKFLEPRSKLQATLSHNWMFSCQCSRCSDPTEMGLFFSSIKCRCGGYFTNSVEEMVGCDQCGEMVEDEAVKTKERNILRMVASAGEDVLADLLEKLDEEFHPTHHIKLRIYSH